VNVETKSEPAATADPEPLKPVVVAVESPVASETQAVNQPATVPERVADPRPRDTAAEPKRWFQTTVKPQPEPAATRASDDHLLRKVAPNRREIRLARSRGGRLDADKIGDVTKILMPLVQRMRESGTLRQSGRADEYIVNEIFLHMLDRMPTASESKIWVDHVKQQQDDATILTLVAALGQSEEFRGSDGTFTRLAHNPKVQTLLRVTYEMPAEKAKALADFVKENVLQPIDVRVVEPGLVVTAEGEVQAPIAAMVSLITGERIVLDLGQHGKPAPNPMAAYAGPPSTDRRLWRGICRANRMDRERAYFRLGRGK
jgi:hypothetical protein